VTSRWVLSGHNEGHYSAGALLVANCFRYSTGRDFQDARTSPASALHRCCRTLLTARTSGKRCMLTTKLASKGDLWVDLRVAGAAVSPWLLSWSYFPIRRAAEGYRECGQEGILAASRTVPDNRLRWRAGVLAPSQRQMENLASEPIGHEVEAYRVKCVWYQFGDENGLKHGRVDRRPLVPHHPRKHDLQRDRPAEAFNLPEVGHS
jgi:hypothetical protein